MIKAISPEALPAAPPYTEIDRVYTPTMHDDVPFHQPRNPGDTVNYDLITTYKKSGAVASTLEKPTRRDHVIAAYVMEQVGGLGVPLFNASLGAAIHVPKAIDPALAKELSQPLGEQRSFGKIVTLADNDSSTHFTDQNDLQQAYRERPRTQVSTDTLELGRWQGLVAEQLDRYLRSVGKVIVFTLYSSKSGDETFALT